MVCRLCFCHSEDYIEIFSEVKILKCIQKFLEMDINQDDPLSKLICGSCWSELEGFQNFYTRIKEAQRQPLIKLKREPCTGTSMDGSFEYVEAVPEEHELNENEREIIDVDTENDEQIVPDNDEMLDSNDVSINNEVLDNNHQNSGTDLPQPSLIKVRNYKRMTKATRSFKNEEERAIFVELMKREEIIWNRKDNLHTSSRSLSEAWKRIAFSMSPIKTVHECKTMWKSLRDALRYERRKAASGFDQGNEIRSLLDFVISGKVQTKPKTNLAILSKKKESLYKLEPLQKYKIQNYHMFDNTNAAWSEKTGEGSQSDLSEEPSKNISNNVSHETVTRPKPHSEVRMFTISNARQANHVESTNEPPPVEYKSVSNDYYGDVKNDLKDEVSNLVEGISKALNRLVTIATTQVQVKSQTSEFKYEYIWKLIECLYAQIEQPIINDLNQKIINMVYEGCKIKVY